MATPHCPSISEQHYDVQQKDKSSQHLLGCRTPLTNSAHQHQLVHGVAAGYQQPENRVIPCPHQLGRAACCTELRCLLRRGAEKIISSAAFYGTMLASALIALFSTATVVLGLLASAPEADSGKDPSAIPGAGPAYFLAAFAMPAALSAVLATAAIYALAECKNWTRNTVTTGTVIACSLILCLGWAAFRQPNSRPRAASAATTGSPAKPNDSSHSEGGPERVCAPFRMPSSKSEQHAGFAHSGRRPIEHGDQRAKHLFNVAQFWLRIYAVAAVAHSPRSLSQLTRFCLRQRLHQLNFHQSGRRGLVAVLQWTGDAQRETVAGPPHREPRYRFVKTGQLPFRPNHRYQWQQLG